MNDNHSQHPAGQHSGHSENGHGASAVPAMLRIYVQVEGEKKPHLVEIPSDARLKDVLAPLAEKGVHVGDDIVMFVEDEEDELPRDNHLHEHGIKHRSNLHCHRCRKIEVRVSLNGTNLCHVFPPSARIAKVKAWAADAFAKSGFEDTHEMALQLAGTTEQPNADVHIGTLVSHPTCELAFNLIGKPLVQG
ncbi:MAG TPA: hypothetical protein VF627_09160 [Abditibacterium sp.]|jgi:hypothetical protein